MSALEIRKVTLIFNKGTINEQLGLRDLSLSLGPKEFVTVIGSNGAGKSTMFNCIGGVYEPDAGQIVLNGRDITYMPEYKRSAFIGRIFQDPMIGTAPDLTIEENLSLAFYRSRNPLGPAVRKEGVEMFRERLAGFGMGLESRMKVKAGLLSGGQRQALSLLMSVISKPKLLLLDEHTAALDPQAAEKVMEITEQVVRENSFPTMMITHNLNAALKTGTRTIMLDAGRVIFDLSTEARDKMTATDLMRMYSERSSHRLDCDRMLLAD